jgi:hypothetical protein
MPTDKLFPIQNERGARPHPLQIPWSVAELAYSVYSSRYGRQQTLERLSQRGGFGPSEMDEYLPDWRERCDTITALQAKLDFLKSKGLTVTTAKTSDQPEPYLVYVIEPHSELSDDIHLEKLAAIEAERDELAGADAMLRAIERIIPRNDAHRDYAETVQLFVEEAAVASSRRQHGSSGMCCALREQEKRRADDLQTKLTATEQRVTDALSLDSKLHDLNRQLLEQLKEMAAKLANAS